MRHRLMATYQGVPYEAGVGPAAGDVVLYAACPPPEELGFQPAPGYWRKTVTRAEIDALWQSRPVGSFRGEPCLVLDDLGDRLHLTYLGTDPQHATHLGYWQVDRGVFELLAPREEVTGLTEERAGWPLGGGDLPPDTGPVPAYPYSTAPWPLVSAPSAPAPPDTTAPRSVPFPVGAPQSLPEPQPAAFLNGAAPGQRPPSQANGSQPVPTGLLAPPAACPPAPPAVPGQGRGRGAGRQRVSTREVFCELADLAAIPRDTYALESETDGAMCLLATADGYEVFAAADGARREVRTFGDEEAAYFYLFGVLAAEAVRSGGLTPR